MVVRMKRTALFAAYQLSLLTGILLLPVALVLRRSVGVVLPLHRFLDTVRNAYEQDADSR